MPALLDVAIGTVFVFLLFSLVVSALNEYILSLTDQRAKFLRMGLAEIFGQKAAAAGFWKSLGKLVTGGLCCGGGADVGKEGEAFLQHGLINALSRSGGEGSPSYIPAGAFVTSLLDVVVTQGAPVMNDTRQIAFANGFLTALQQATPAAGSSITFTAFDAELGKFLADYGSLTAVPVPDSPLDVLKRKVEEARVRAAAQQDLLGAADLSAARSVLVKPAYAACKPELEALIQKAGTDFAVFQKSVQNWLSLDDSRGALEFATVSTMAGLLKTTAEHNAAAIKAGIERLPNEKLKSSLLSLYRAVDGDVLRFKTAVEGWFNGSMDRVSGWYKRFTQKWMIAFGFLLAASFNVDTLEIVRVLSNNPNLAKAVASQATVYVSSNGRPLTAEDLAKTRDLKLQKVKDAEKKLEDLKNPLATGTPAENTSAPARSAKEIEKEKQESIKAAEEELAKAKAEITALQDYQSAAAKLTESDLPVGWSPEARQRLGLAVPGDKFELTPIWTSMEKGKFRWNILFQMMSGWALTALAASLGAPFWFDLLGRFVNVRAAGRSPGEKEATSTPTKPPPANLDTTPGTSSSPR